MFFLIEFQKKLNSFRFRAFAQIKSYISGFFLEKISDEILVSGSYGLCTQIVIPEGESYFSEFAKYLRQNNSCSLKSYVDYHNHLT